MFSRRTSIYKEIIRNRSKFWEPALPLDGFNTEHVEFFMKTLELTKLKTHKILSKYPNLHKFDLDRLQQAHKMLDKFGFSKSDLRDEPNVLAILPASIEQHILVLQEVGFTKIDTACLRSYISLGRKPITLLKAYQYIPEETNVKERLLSYLDDSFSINRTIEDSLTLNAIRLIVVSEYLKWYLNLTDDETTHLFKTYIRIKNKSLRMIRKSLKQLEELGFSKEKIKRNGYLIHSHPENNEKILSDVKEIAGQDIKEVLFKFPKLLMTNSETLIKTSKYLKEFEIPESSVRRCLPIFTLGSESVYERLQDLKTIPEFRALWSHPRVLRLVLYQKKALSRLQYLQHMKVKCASLHVLSSSRTEFEKYAREGLDRTKGKDIVAFLRNEFGLTTPEVRESLNRHVFWCHVPVITAQSTLSMLRERSYLNKHLMNNIQILLYPRDDVQSKLDELANNRTHPDLPGIEDITNLDRGKILSLCMYLLEKKHHFSGNGIWEEVLCQDAAMVEMNAPLPQETLGKNINYRYLLDKNKS